MRLWNMKVRKYNFLFLIHSTEIINLFFTCMETHLRSYKVKDYYLFFPRITRLLPSISLVVEIIWNKMS